MILDLQDKLFHKDKEIERLLTLTKNNSKDPANHSSPNHYASDRKSAENVLAEFNRELREELSEAYLKQQHLEEENCALKRQVTEQVKICSQIQIITFECAERKNF